MKKILLALFLIIIAFSNVLPQSGKIIILLKKPPPYQFNVEDFWKVTIINNTGTTISGFLYGIATKTGEGKIIDANSTAFRIPPGSKEVNPRDIGPITVIDKNPKYADVIKYIGGLPTGDYDICVSLINPETKEVIAQECYSHSVELLSGIELLSPVNSAVLMSGIEKQVKQTNSNNDTGSAKYLRKEPPIIWHPPIYPPVPDFRQRSLSDFETQKGYVEKTQVTGSQVLFSWLPPTPAPRSGSIKYKLVIKEIIANQSSYDAMQSNPSYYTINNLTTTSYQYPLSARDFKSGRRYSWMVYGMLNNTVVSQSEIYEFEFSNASESSTDLRYSGLNKIQSKKYLGDNSNTNNNSIENSFKQYVLEKLNGNKLSSGSEQVQKSQSILFNGSVKVFGEKSGKSPAGSDMPNSYGNVELSPSLTLYGIPLGSTFLFSTLNEKNRQNINSFAIGFDKSFLENMVRTKIESEIEKIKGDLEKKVTDKITKYKTQIEYAVKDPQKIRELVQEEEQKYRYQLGDEISERTYKNLPAYMKVMNAFNTLGIGKNYPDYSENTLSGVPVTGLNFEFNPGLFYVSLTGLRNQDAIDYVSYKRNLIAGRIGIGKKDGSHFILSLMNIRDDENSIIPDTNANSTLKPKENWVMGLDGKLNLLNNMISLQGEGVVSMLTRDVRDPELTDNSIPKFIQDIFKPKGSSSADFMYSFKATYDNDKSNTKIIASMKMLGPGFYTLGNPSLRNDKLQFEGKIEQQFMERQISLSAGVRNLKDNLLETKTATTSTNSVNLSIGLNFRNYPTFKVIIAPFSQKNDKSITSTDSSKMDIKTMLISTISGYSYKYKGMNLSTFAMYSFNNSNTLFGRDDYSINSFQLTQSLTFKIPLTIQGTFGFTNQSFKSLGDSRLFNFVLNSNYTLLDNWQIGGGIDYSFENNKNNRTLIFLNINSMITNFLNLDFRAEQKWYNDKVVSANSLNDFILRGTITTLW